MATWLWLKIKQEGLRGFWSMFPLTDRVPFGYRFFEPQPHVPRKTHRRWASETGGGVLLCGSVSDPSSRLKQLGFSTNGTYQVKSFLRGRGGNQENSAQERWQVSWDPENEKWQLQNVLDENHALVPLGSTWSLVPGAGLPFLDSPVGLVVLGCGGGGRG